MTLDQVKKELVQLIMNSPNPEETAQIAADAFFGVQVGRTW